MSSQNTQTFPLGRIVVDAYMSLYHHFGYAVRICWAWVLIMTSARIAADLLKNHVLVDAAGAPMLGFDLTFFIGWFLFVPVASIAVAWHRLLLFGARERSAIYLRLDRLVWSYFGLAVALYVISLLPVFFVRGMGELIPLIWGLPEASGLDGAAPPGTLLSPTPTSIVPGMQVVAFLVFLALSARLSVILPGKALALQGMSIRRAWMVTRGHTWSLMMGFISCVVPFLLLTALLRRSGFDFSLEDGALLHIVDWLAIESMGAMLGLIELAYLTLCFRFFFPQSNERLSNDRSDGAEV